MVVIPLADLHHHKPLTIAPSATAADAVRQMQAGRCRLPDRRGRRRASAASCPSATWS